MINQQKVIELSSSGSSVRDIANILKCSTANIKYILRKHKIKWKFRTSTDWKLVNIIGQTFGRLTVLERAPVPETVHAKKPRPYWLCSCECGNYRVVSGYLLKEGTTISCGCFRRETTTENNHKNKLSKDPKRSAARRAYRANYANLKRDSITFEEWLPLTQLPCVYCGTIKSNRLNRYKSKNKHNPNKVKNISDEAIEQSYFEYNGLDRVDPTKGHTKENVVPCCRLCNRIKSNMTLEEFKNYLLRACAWTNFGLSTVELQSLV